MRYTFPAPVINTLTSPDGASQKKARTEVNWLENCKTAGSWQTSVKKRRLTPNLETLLSLDQWCLPKIRQQCISYHRIICTWFVFVMRYGWSSLLCPTESRLTSVSRRHRGWSQQPWLRNSHDRHTAPKMIHSPQSNVTWTWEALLQGSTHLGWRREAMTSTLKWCSLTTPGWPLMAFSETVLCLICHTSLQAPRGAENAQTSNLLWRIKDKERESSVMWGGRGYTCEVGGA